MKALLIFAITIFSTSVHAANSNCVGSKSNELVELSTAAQEIQDNASTDLRQEVDRSKDEFKQLNAIGMISVDGQNYDGSAWLLDSCHVLTNAHVAYREDEAMKDGKDIFFSVGQTNDKSHPFIHEMLRGRVIGHGNYERTVATKNSDWVVIKLDQKIEDEKIDSVKMVQVDPAQMRDLKYSTAGFPADKSRKDNYSKMFGDLDCKIIGISVYGYALHNCQTNGGQSGSPILFKSPKDGRYYAFSMVSGGAKGSSGLNKTTDPNLANSAVSFHSGESFQVETDGDKIAKAIKNNPCSP